MAAVQRAAFRAAIVPLLPDEYELPPTELWREGLRQGLASEGVGALLAEVETTCVGQVVFGPVRGADPPLGAGEIRSLFVARAHWRCGVGSALVRAALAELSGLGYRRALLWSLCESEGANAFYERLGFVRDGATQVRRQLGATEVRYARELEPADRAARVVPGAGAG